MAGLSRGFDRQNINGKTAKGREAIPKHQGGFPFPITNNQGGYNMDMTLKCKQDGKGGYEHKHCGGQLAISSKGEVQAPVGFGFINGVFVFTVLTQKAFSGVCMKCHAEGGFRISGTKATKNVPCKDINNKIMKQLANPN